MMKAPDPIAFIRANWGLHARIAAVSPNVMLRSLYSSPLDLIESHTLSVLPAGGQPLTDYIAERYELHAGLVEAIAGRDKDQAIYLITEHNTTDRLRPPPGVEHGRLVDGAETDRRPHRRPDRGGPRPDGGW